MGHIYVLAWKLLRKELFAAIFGGLCFILALQDFISVLYQLDGLKCKIRSKSFKDTIVDVNLNLQSLRNFQGSNYQASIQRITPQKNRFGVTFSTAKTATNIALETKSDDELVQLLKNFILAKRNPGANNNSNEIENSEAQDENGIVTLNQHLIDQTRDPHVTKIRGAPRKKIIKSAIEMSKAKTVGQEITN
ncbi:hypothetical protein C2G38_2289356 [Gigaspora rosea]|uniref:Uncharacterized protein n=1 Tax=Gigaspora rosea TaxID=44941 RepID=A0A397U2N5_9GLOM|nr:hypothetical protein C2G38_2289356 [Gigaspora rosea]